MQHIILLLDAVQCILCFKVYFTILVYVKVESKCTITPKSPSSLTAEGGILTNNPMNVEIECKCVNERGAALKNIQWLTPAKHQIKNKNGANSGVPYSYSTRNDTVTGLMFPIFSDIHNGTYTCTTGNHGSDGNLMATIMLTCKPGSYFVHAI